MRRASFISLPDPFLLCLIAVVVAASLLPVRGSAVIWFDVLADIAIALLFFLHGAKLSRAVIVRGIGNWRLHLFTLASTYVLFPIAGFATTGLAQGLVNPLLATGLLFLTLLPSTVQSSIAFTAMARGNVAAAVCSASLSNLLGIVLTPLLVGGLLRTGMAGAGLDWQGVKSIVLQLLVPFLAGHFLRPWIGGFVDRNKRILMPVDRGSILLVVYSAFSAAVVNGIWKMLGWSDLAWLLMISAAMLAVVLAGNVLAARLTRMPREDAIVLLFCGSKKSLVSGVPMAGALFAPAQVGLIVLPLMIFHQLQLFVCAWLAARFARAYDAAHGDPEVVSMMPETRLPRTPEEIAVAARERGLSVPAPCLPGVVANLDLLSRHAERLRRIPEAGIA